MSWAKTSFRLAKTLLGIALLAVLFSVPASSAPTKAWSGLHGRVGGDAEPIQSELDYLRNQSQWPKVFVTIDTQLLDGNNNPKNSFFWQFLSDIKQAGAFVFVRMYEPINVWDSPGYIAGRIAAIQRHANSNYSGLGFIDYMPFNEPNVEFEWWIRSWCQYAYGYDCPINTWLYWFFVADWHRQVWNELAANYPDVFNSSYIHFSPMAQEAYAEEFGVRWGNRFPIVDADGQEKQGAYNLNTVKDWFFNYSDGFTWHSYFENGMYRYSQHHVERAFPLWMPAEIWNKVRDGHITEGSWHPCGMEGWPLSPCTIQPPSPWNKDSTRDGAGTPFWWQLKTHFYEAWDAHTTAAWLASSADFLFKPHVGRDENYYEWRLWYREWWPIAD